MNGQDSAVRRGGSPQELAADIHATRRELAATVEALAHKADVRARFRLAAARWRVQLHELIGTARTRARGFGRRG